MINSIWHSKDEKPKPYKIIFQMDDVVGYGVTESMPDDDYSQCRDSYRWCYVKDLLKLEAELEKFKIAQASFGIDAPVDYETACEINNQIMDRNDKLKNENKILKRALCVAIERLDGYARLYKGQPSDIPEVTGTYNAVGALSENTLLEIKTILNI